MYIVGGMAGDTNPQCSVMKYDVEQDIWDNLPSFDVPRYATFSFLVNDKLYVIGKNKLLS